MVCEYLENRAGNIWRKILGIWDNGRELYPQVQIWRCAMAASGKREMENNIWLYRSGSESSDYGLTKSVSLDARVVCLNRSYVANREFLGYTSH